MEQGRGAEAMSQLYLCITSDAQGAVQDLGRMEAGSPADGCWRGKGSRDSLSLLLRFFQAQSPAGPLANPPPPIPFSPFTILLFHFSLGCSPKDMELGEPLHHEGAW